MNESGKLARDLPVEQSPEPRPLRDGTTVGPYRILTLIATGGMGQVYRARDERLGRDVALKILPGDLTNDRERIERFAQEAKAASALNHPHIVAIYEIGRARPTFVVQPISQKERPDHSEVHYLAMELVDGVTLREFLDTQPSLSRRLEVLAQTAEGLGKAHAAGIVHRDLKPDNVMVSNDGWAKVVDFGLAKLVEPARGWNPLGADSPTMRAITAQGDLIGTAGYMSPEHVLGKVVDQRSDIFSFGCMLHEAVTGSRPFEGDSFVDTLYQVLHATPPFVTWPEAHIEHELQRIIGKCLVKDRENRYQSIRDVALDLHALRREIETGASQASGPIRIPAPFVGVAGKEIRLPGAVLAAMLLLAVVILALVVGNASRPQAERTAAKRRGVAQRITSSGTAQHLAVSPDGRFAVSCSYEEGKGQSLWLHHLATGSQTRIAAPELSTFYQGLTFTSDSNHLLATRYEGTIYGVVVELPLLGGTPRVLIRDADTGPTISPDGTRVAVTRNVLDKGEAHLLVTARDGSRERVLARFSLPEGAQSPAWSPDGTRIAVAHGSSLFTIDVASGSQRSVPLGQWHGAIRDVSWTPAGDAFVVGAADEQSAGHYQLIRIDADTGAMRMLTDDDDDYADPHPMNGATAAIRTKRQASLWTVAPGEAPRQVTRGLDSSTGLRGTAWTADGRIVYTSSNAGTVDLWTAGADGSGARQLTDDDRVEATPTIAANGEFIVYLTSGRGKIELWRMNVNGTDARFIASSPLIFHFAITPDSKRVVYAAREQNAKRASIMTVPVSGGAPVKIADTGVFVRSLALTPDGQTVVFTALEDMAVKPFKVSMNGGTPVKLANVRAADAVLSPDGRFVVAELDVDTFAGRAVIIDVDGKQPARILEAGGFLFRWSPDSRSLLFLRRDGPRENVFAMPVEGGPAHQVTQFAEGYISNFRHAPDGKTLLLTQFMQSSDAVMVR